jgi:hypothetical protein
MYVDVIGFNTSVEYKTTEITQRLLRRSLEDVNAEARTEPCSTSLRHRVVVMIVMHGPENFLDAR